MRLYESDDYPTIQEWYVARGVPVPLPGDFPKVGFIEDLCAAGFLTETDTPCAILDFFISNPECPAGDRSKALDLITQNLISHAKRKGFRRVICTTSVPAIHKRAVSMKFVPIKEHWILMRNI